MQTRQWEAIGQCIMVDENIPFHDLDHRSEFDMNNHYQEVTDQETLDVEWECSACTFVNQDTLFLTCKMCGTERPTTNTTSLSIREPRVRASENESIKKKTSNTVVVGTCSICFEESVPLIFLMKRCREHHEPSCHDCLRRIYVVDAQQSISNFPLQCYHPNCKIPVRETQLVNHNLVKTKAELTRYFRFIELAKGHRGGTSMTTAHCPECDHPRSFKSAGGLFRVFACKECRYEFAAPDTQSLIQTLDGLPQDSVGHNDGWAQCPRCKVVISKGYGCDHMHCGMCGHDFSWSEAQARRGKYSNKVYNY